MDTAINRLFLAAPVAPGVAAATLWLMLLGLGFFALLRSHLRHRDLLADTQAQLDIERRARLQAERALGDTQTALSRLVQEREGVRETERKRIARDIHDDLGQNLLALKLELCALQSTSGGAPPQLGERLGAMAGNLDLTIKSLRTVINDLRPIALDAGLQSAMEWQLKEFSRISGIRHRFDADPAAFRSDSDKQVDAMLFRILQESLSNVVRHACASEVRVTLRRKAGHLTLRVQDDGVGMPEAVREGASGLDGIRDRVTAIGGRFSIESQPGAGTALSLSIPFEAPVAAQ